ncbi:MAG: peptidase domain-containing ABC transporter [Chitinophagaceae bacterium]|jgi:ABC-type bacteriocin transporter|nr:peptidase domain-containing ABC transporter [Chitinophagaceae bacterium]MCA6469118.1 peptidase domain-containing ABC transporter [Chitinophagaceae bacterium]MCA6476744.1 peptidase domain-containing ABC transporter [Chitinophagaceae bacterium]MCA6480237.1 peptidase domain-containing ABC transporter [Chitinophagaceae bacterium]MCA6491759.1 peptidase domain-containing ABC transporter [Chitinophagaceae bacterium]
MNKRVRIKQRDITDCGATCLASIAMHYNLQLPVSRIRQYAGTDKRGTNVLGLIGAAERLGFQAKGAKGQLESLAKVPLPAIAHVVLKNGLHHYVVIYKFTKKKLAYMDPGDGDFHTVSLAKFQEIWSGVIVLLLPDDGFVTGKQKISNAARFWQLIRPHSAIMVQALVGALVYTILGLSTSIYMQKIIDFVLVEGNIRLLNLLSVAMIVILIFQLIIGGYKTVFGLQTGQMIDARLILGYYKHLLKLPQRFFDTMRVGEIISRVNDAVNIREFINNVALNFIVNGLIVIFSIVLMFFYYWKLALIMLAIIPVYLLIYWISNKVNKKWQRRLMEESAELESQLVESLNAVGTIKRFGLETFANDKTEVRFVTLLRTIYKTSIYSLYIGTGSEFFTRLFTIILLWAGSYFVIQRELSPGELLSFYALVGYFTGPASSLIGANKNIQDALIAADRLFEIIDLETESSNENKIELTPEQIGDIYFNNVTFRYGSRTTVFEGLNLAISKGQSTAIVGESGSGKSTLLSLLQNMYPLKEGNITIGGLDLQHISNRSLRQMVGVVPQNIDLFTGTIIDNIAIGDNEPDMQRVLSLSKMIGIDDFIEKLPNTYNSIVSEQGVNLSGGQRQRIAIVRALYRNPEILILDEATSSLDPASEQKVQDSMNWFKAQGKTVIIIAHRLTTIRNCDNILVLSHGKLVEQGSHHQLMQSNGHYKGLWNYHTETI